MALSLNRSHIAVLNSNYLFRGLVVTGNKRLSDMLNDRLSPAIKLLDVRVYSLTDLATSIFAAPEFYIRRQQFDLFVILKEETSALTQRLYAYVPKERHQVTLYVAGFQVQGELHLKQKQDATGALGRESDLFVPITEATLVSVGNARLRFPAATIMVREAALDAFSLAEETLTQRST